MAAAHHELPKFLRPRRGSLASVGTGEYSGIRLSSVNVIVDSGYYHAPRHIGCFGCRSWFDVDVSLCRDGARFDIDQRRFSEREDEVYGVRFGSRPHELRDLPFRRYRSSATAEIADSLAIGGSEDGARLQGAGG